jgi:hypothetical protein
VAIARFFVLLSCAIPRAIHAAQRSAAVLASALAGSPAPVVMIHARSMEAARLFKSEHLPHHCRANNVKVKGKRGCAVSHMRRAADPVLSNRGYEAHRRDVSMSLAWLVVAIGVIAILAKWVTWLDRHGKQSDLGFVSQQWLMEHRLAQISDPQR